MTAADKRRLIGQATKLASLGLTVERERNKLRKLVEHGVAYNDPRMIAALERFEKADAEWKRLETEHLGLRRRLGME